MFRGVCARGGCGVFTAVAVAGSISTAASAAFIVIDDFTMVGAPNPWPVTLNAPGVQVVNEDVANVLGGHRRSSITAIALAMPGLDFVQVQAFPPGGLFDYVTSAGMHGMVELAYDGAGAMSADFTGQSGIMIDFALFDFANGVVMPVTVIIGDGSNTANLTVHLTTAGPQVAMFDFASFSGIGTVALSDIRSISVLFEPGEATDFRITQIFTVVPGPGSLALLGVAGLMGRRRRRA
jgi:hypothetical protein